MCDLESKYPCLMEFMEKSLYQGAAPSMEEAIAAYAINGQHLVNAVLSDIDNALAGHAQEKELLEFIGRHSEYLEPEGAYSTLSLIKSVLVGALS